MYDCRVVGIVKGGNIIIIGRGFITEVIIIIVDLFLNRVLKNGKEMRYRTVTDVIPVLIRVFRMVIHPK